MSQQREAMHSYLAMLCALREGLLADIGAVQRSIVQVLTDIEAIEEGQSDEPAK